MKILIVEPFFTGSHAAWAEGYARHSVHDVAILSLPGNYWKWRMHGGAVTLARQFLQRAVVPDLLLASDMLDLTTFLALIRTRTARPPTAIYFHENQITYPWSPQDRDVHNGRDHHYGFINFASALAAGRLFFNSTYHMSSFIEALPGFLKQFPDHQEQERVAEIMAKSEVLPLGLDLHGFDAARPTEEPPSKARILWNHRWEYDKNPREFFEALGVLSNRKRTFEVIVAGETFDVVNDNVTRGIDRLGDRVVHAGYVDDRADYARLLWRANILPVTSRQDFFGASAVEAMYCDCFPLLPRRLAFPELVSAARHDECFYNDFDDLVERLDGAVYDANNGVVTSFREDVARFDWQVMAPHYDAALAGVVAPK